MAPTIAKKMVFKNSSVAIMGRTLNKVPPVVPAVILLACITGI